MVTFLRKGAVFCAAILLMTAFSAVPPAEAVAPSVMGQRAQPGVPPAAANVPSFTPPTVEGQVLAARAPTDLDLSDAWEPEAVTKRTFAEGTARGAFGETSVGSLSDMGVSVTPDGVSTGAGLPSNSAPSNPAEVEVRRLSSDEAAWISPFGNAVQLQFLDSAGSRMPPPSQYTVGLDIDPAEFQGGADLLGRLRLVRYEDCSDVDGVVRCELAQPLASSVDVTTGLVSAAVDTQALDRAAAEIMEARSAAGILPSDGAAAPADGNDAFIALDAGPTTNTGDFTATPIESLSVYEVASYTGSAEVSYTVPVPEAAAGPAPSVAFTYSSSSIDGMNFSSNNQAGPIGLGWSLMTGGSITRQFAACNALADGGTPQDKCPTGPWGDLDEERFSITLNGVSSKLVRVAGNEFRLLNDPMWRVFRRLGQSTHGYDGGESWEVQTPDGTRWILGTTTNSARNVPVYFQEEFGDRPPGCTDINRVCNMVYQWDLKRVVDTLGNTAEYTYQQETNYYNARGLGPSRQYVRASVLREIAYGMNDDAGGGQNAGEANARVVFDWEVRCADSRTAATCTPTQEQFPDVPVEQWCRDTAAPCRANQAPTFFSFLRLGSVATQIRQADLTWLTRDVHDLVQYFPEAPNDTDGSVNPPKLALAQIKQRPNGTNTGSLYRHYGFSPIRGVDFDSSTGSVSTDGASGEIGFDAVASQLSDGDELAYRKVWLGGSGDGSADQIAVRYANGASAGSMDVVVNGSVAATVNLPPTAGFSTYATVTADVPGLTGVADVTLRFSGPGTEFGRLAWVQFNATDFDQIPSLPPVTYGSNGNWEFKQNRVNGDVGLPLQPSMKMPRIKMIENELGAKVTFDYSEPTCEIPDPANPAWNVNEKWCYPALEEVSGRPVAWFKYTVDEMVVDPGSGQPTITTAFEYSQPRWAFSNPADDCGSKPTWNEFRGHNKVRITDGSGISEYRYFQGMDGDESDCTGLDSLTGPVTDSQGNSFTDSRWLQGQSYEMRRFDPDGTELERETTSYDTEAGPITPGDEAGIFTTAGSGKDAARFIAPAGTSSTILIGEDKTKETRFFYDVHGNVVRENQAGDVDDDTDDRLVTMEYVKNTDAWIVQTRCRDSLASAADPDTPVSETRWGYDTDRSQSADTACSANPTEGLVTNEWAFHTETSANQSTTGYNQRGQATSTIDPKGNTDQMTFDPLHGWYLGDTNPLGWQSSYRYDELGHQISIVDVNNNETRLAHDEYDRLSRVWLPGIADDPSYAFEYALEERPVEVRTKTLFDASRDGDEQYLIVAEYLDGLSRGVQRQSRAQTDGNRWVTSMSYDGAGRLQRESTAYEIPGEPGSNAVIPAGDWSTVPLHHVYTYDARDEMIRDRTLGNAPGQATTDWSMSYVFDGWTTQGMDEDGFRTDHQHDAFANPTKLVEYDEVGQPYATTVHAYDAADRLQSTTDDQGNVVDIGYDLLGRRVELDDPNAGRWLFSYDPNSNLTLQRDGRGVWTGFDYDPIDRVEQRYLSDDAGTVTEVQATYEYDGTIGRDRLRAKTAFTPEGEVVVENVAYDVQGQILEQVTSVPGSVGGTFRQKFGWGPGGQQTALHYPQRNNGETGEVVTTTFDWRTGQPIALESDVRGVLVADTRYGPDGQERSRTYGPDGADAAENWDIDIRTERTTTYQAGTGGQLSNVIGFGYAYNNRGDTTRIADGVNAGQTQCFTYDAQSRLTRAFTGTNDCAAADPARGDDPYDELYGYDTIHNLTSNAVKGALTYGEGDGAAGPHAVTSTGSGDTYGYDYNGNQTDRSVDGQQLTIRFDAQNQIDRIEEAQGGGAVAVESYLYDADHERVLRTQQGNAVVYVGQTYEWTTVASDTSPRAPGPDPQVPDGDPDDDNPPGRTGISGTVTTADGKPAPNVQVDLFRAAKDGSRGEFLTFAVTDEAGKYSFDAAPGCYVLTFIAPDGDSFEGSRWLQRGLCVKDGETTEQNAVLDKRTVPVPTAIEGKVTTAEGTPVAGLMVDLFQAASDGSRGQFLGQEVTGNDGTYRFTPKPGCYVLTFIGRDGQTFGGSRWFQAGVCVKDGQVATQNAQLDKKRALHPTEAAAGRAAADVSGQAVAGATGTANELAAEGMTAHYFLGGRRVAVLASGDLSYTLHDHLNSAAANVGRNGSVEIARYRPWGQERTDPLSGSLGFGGQRKSDLTGLSDFDSRFYDPGLGRFISPDTSMADFSDPAALNRYSYVANNPMTYFDPTGEWGLSSIKNAVKKVATTTVAATKTVATAVSKIDPHTALDIAGMLPDPVGTVADLANAAYYLAEGDYKNAAISGLAMLPVVGSGAAVLRKACKMGCDKAVKATSELSDDVARQASKRFDDIPCNSFVPGTGVLMADGTYKPIEDVNVGEFVWSEDPNTGMDGGREVVRTISGVGTKKLIEIDTGSGTFVATDEHPIWVNNEGVWLAAGDVRPGDLLLDSDGVTVAVEQVTLTTATAVTVHNLTVEDLHTFFVLVGDDDILSHNSNVCALGSDLRTRNNVKRLRGGSRTDANLFYVVSHGTKGRGLTNGMNADELAGHIAKSGWRRGQTVCLVVCHAKRAGFAQRVADVLDTNVIASGGRVRIGEAGELVAEEAKRRFVTVRPTGVR